MVSHTAHQKIITDIFPHLHIYFEVHMGITHYLSISINLTHNWSHSYNASISNNICIKDVTFTHKLTSVQNVLINGLVRNLAFSSVKVVPTLFLIYNNKIYSFNHYTTHGTSKFLLRPKMTILPLYFGIIMILPLGS